jgi:spore coat protein U-like protein
MKHASIVSGLVLMMLGLAFRPALAATSTASFNVTATVVDTCSIGSTSATFGAYVAAMADPTSAVSVQCILKTPYNVSLRAGQAAAITTNLAGIAPRMTVDTELLASANPVNRGRLPSSQQAVKSGSGSSQQLVVNGRNLAVQSETSGDYPDSVLITVAY